MIYKDYIKENLPDLTDEQIENEVSGLFGIDAEMGEPIEYRDNCYVYNINGYIYYSNFSSHDTCELVDKEGNVLEDWILF